MDNSVQDRLERIRQQRTIPVHPGNDHLARTYVGPATQLDAELMHLNHWALEAQEVEAELEHAVARAVTQGASWAQIGLQLGITKQAAHQRYSEAVRWSQDGRR